MEARQEPEKDYEFENAVVFDEIEEEKIKFANDNISVNDEIDHNNNLKRSKSCSDITRLCSISDKNNGSSLIFKMFSTVNLTVAENLDQIYTQFKNLSSDLKHSIRFNEEQEKIIEIRRELTEISDTIDLLDQKYEQKLRLEIKNIMEQNALDAARKKRREIENNLKPKLQPKLPSKLQEDPKCNIYNFFPRDDGYVDKIRLGKWRLPVRDLNGTVMETYNSETNLALIPKRDIDDSNIDDSDFATSSDNEDIEKYFEKRKVWLIE